MRLICSVFLLAISISVFSQEEVFQKKIVKLEDALNSSDKLGVRISTCREIIEISFPDHLDFVLEYTKELMKLSEAANDVDSKAFAFFYMGEYFYRIDDFENAEINYNEALILYQNLKKNSQIAQINQNLGLANHLLNQYDKALEFYQKSIEIFEDLGNKEKIAISYQDIGTLYFDLHKYTLAQHYSCVIARTLELLAQCLHPPK